MTFWRAFACVALAAVVMLGVFLDPWRAAPPAPAAPAPPAAPSQHLACGGMYHDQCVAVND